MGFVYITLPKVKGRYSSCCMGSPNSGIRGAIKSRLWRNISPSWHRTCEATTRATSRPGVAHYHIDRLTGDVEGLIRALHAERAVIIGHDWGGGVAWAFAAHYPHMTERLVCFELSPSGSIPESAHKESPAVATQLVYLLLSASVVAGVGTAFVQTTLYRAGVSWHGRAERSLPRRRATQICRRHCVPPAVRGPPSIITGRRFATVSAMAHYTCPKFQGRPS